MDVYLLKYFPDLPAVQWILPVGISFYTLQALSYLIDLYRTEEKPVEQLLDFALYLAFFPQLLAGPIERSRNLIPQFDSAPPLTHSAFLSGFRLLMWGLFKKLIVADKLALLVNPVFAHPGEYQSLYLATATLAFSLQIYCDFSGYSDMAIGSAQLLGISLSANFQRPYLAKNLIQFWQKWHITLYTWFKDYVYRSLGGNGNHNWRWIFSILTVFLISGIWHGPHVTFLIWGLYHGLLYLLTYFVLKKTRFKGVGRMLGPISTFLLVSLGWIFFRTESLSDSLTMLKEIFTLSHYQVSMADLSLLQTKEGMIRVGWVEMGVIGMVTLLFLLLSSIPAREWNVPFPVSSRQLVQTLLFVDFIVVLLILLGDWAGSQFIYYQF